MYFQEVLRSSWLLDESRQIYWFREESRRTVERLTLVEFPHTKSIGADQCALFHILYVPLRVLCGWLRPSCEWSDIRSHLLEWDKVVIRFESQDWRRELPQRSGLWRFALVHCYWVVRTGVQQTDTDLGI